MDFCDMVRELECLGVDFIVHVVGFGVSDEDVA